MTIEVSEDVYAENPEFQDIIKVRGQASPSPSRPHPPQQDMEASQQIALMQWRDLMVGQYPALRWLWHPANGEDRHPAVAAKLKAMGVVKGVADLILLVPRGPYHGFIGELKAGRNTPTAEQVDFLAFHDEMGYYCALHWDWQEMAAEIIAYLEMG